jgi:hypothetical protein
MNVAEHTTLRSFYARAATAPAPVAPAELDADCPGKVYAILGFRAPHYVIVREELAELQARNANLGVRITVSRPGNPSWSGAVGHIDAADEPGVFIDNTCRSGMCGLWRTKLVLGNVPMAVEDALFQEEKAEGYMLASHAIIRTHVRVAA